MSEQQPATETRPTPDSGRSAFEQAAGEKSRGVVGEFVDFLLTSKKWWLTPIIVVLLMVGALVLLSSTAAAPFIYTLF